MAYEVIWQSTLAGLATVLGALAVVALGRPGERVLAVLLGFAGGVMTAVVVFDLIPSALDYGSMLTAWSGFLLGLLFMLGLDLVISLLPGLQNAGPLGLQGRFLKMGYLIAVGIALHDLPEGIAIAVGYSAKESLGILIALSIGLHNIPEGMATAAPLNMGGMSKRGIILTCLAISLFTPLGSCLGLLLVSISGRFICLLLALAGGAMAFIVKNELIPEAYRWHPSFARTGFLLGILLILLLTVFQH
ncbi:MAG: ZIP family metal transporter [Peptococcaceae bacterium]|jgi:ZIP family zinc transporter|nr:ZIP family metal transporter [Peptococcaceae bacterium]MDH7525868.1 ZIP family metal transporter [Peptococcaceae bacterium]